MAGIKERLAFERHVLAVEQTSRVVPRFRMRGQEGPLRFLNFKQLGLGQRVCEPPRYEDECVVLLPMRQVTDVNGDIVERPHESAWRGRERGDVRTGSTVILPVLATGIARILPVPATGIARILPVPDTGSTGFQPVPIRYRLDVCIPSGEGSMVMGWHGGHGFGQRRRRYRKRRRNRKLGTNSLRRGTARWLAACGEPRLEDWRRA